MLSSYKKSLLFEDRLRKANLLIAKYPGRVPVICEKYQGQDNPDIDKNKYLVPEVIGIEKPDFSFDVANSFAAF